MEDNTILKISILNEVDKRLDAQREHIENYLKLFRETIIKDLKDNKADIFKTWENIASAFNFKVEKTLRDEFAMAVMSAMIIAHGNKRTYEYISMESYRLAQEMLKMKKKIENL